MVLSISSKETLGERMRGELKDTKKTSVTPAVCREKKQKLNWKKNTPFS